MYQIGRHAGALNVDLMSNQPGERRCYRLCSGAVLEKRWKMFEGRAAQVDLILLLSVGSFPIYFGIRIVHMKAIAERSGS